MNDRLTKMREAGRLTARVLEAVTSQVVPGVTTLALDAFCERYITETLQAIPGSKGQYDYPYCINTSVNHVICHGMPNDKKLKQGDIVNIDVTVKKDGVYGDSSKMFCVGQVAPHAQRLVDITQECLYRAIAAVKPGVKLGTIGHIIQTHAESNSYSVVREYCGHGIGEKMHLDPQVLHYGTPDTGVELTPGMTFTIEPMINQGKRHIKNLNDGWTVITKDRRLSAQWEHTLLVTDTGVEILTLREEEQAPLTELGILAPLRES